MADTMRERLARAAFGKSIASEDLETEGAYVVVDAILREMQDPSYEMISAMMRGFVLTEPPRVAMRDALINGLAFALNEKTDG